MNTEDSEMAGNQQEESGSAMLPSSVAPEEEECPTLPEQEGHMVIRSVQKMLTTWGSLMASQQEARMDVMARQQEAMLTMFSNKVQQLATKEELTAVMGERMEVLETRVNTYTEETCTRVKEEVKEGIKTVEERWRADLQCCADRVAMLEEHLARKEESASYLDPRDGGNTVERRLAGTSSLPALPLATSPPSPPVAPPHIPLSPPPDTTHYYDTQNLPAGKHLVVNSVEGHPQGVCVGGKVGYERKVTEYDGKVSFDAYQAQYEVIARRQRWTQEEKAFQLVSVLKGQALEVLKHLTPAQLWCYDSVAGALQRRFGRRRQPEVFRAQLKNRRRGKDEALPILAQGVEALVRGVYPMASEDTVDMLAKDCFVDALQNRQLQIHVKQAAPKNVQETLSRAAEFEAFLVSSGPVPSSPSNVTGWMSHPRRRWVRRVQTSGGAPQPGGKGESDAF